MLEAQLQFWDIAQLNMWRARQFIQIRGQELTERAVIDQEYEELFLRERWEDPGPATVDEGGNREMLEVQGPPLSSAIGEQGREAFKVCKPE